MRTTKYSLPAAVHAHVEFVQPTTLFTSPKKMASNVRLSSQGQTEVDANAPPISVPSAYQGKVDASCNSTITISCLKQLYNIGPYKTSATNGNKIGITGYLEQYANIADLQLFFADQRPDALNSSFQFISVNGEAV